MIRGTMLAAAQAGRKKEDGRTFTPEGSEQTEKHTVRAAWSAIAQYLPGRSLLTLGFSRNVKVTRIDLGRTLQRSCCIGDEL